MTDAPTRPHFFRRFLGRIGAPTFVVVVVAGYMIGGVSLAISCGIVSVLCVTLAALLAHRYVLFVLRSGRS